MATRRDFLKTGAGVAATLSSSRAECFAAEEDKDVSEKAAVHIELLECVVKLYDEWRKPEKAEDFRPHVNEKAE